MNENTEKCLLCGNNYYNYSQGIPRFVGSGLGPFCSACIVTAHALDEIGQEDAEKEIKFWKLKKKIVWGIEQEQ